MQKSIDEILRIFLEDDFLFHYEKKGIIKLDGADSFKFLNGISSNEVIFNNSSISVDCLILTIKGRILFDIEIYANNDKSLYILHDIDQKIDIIEYLEKYRMSYKIEITDLNNSFKIFKGKIKKNNQKSLNFKSAQILEEDFTIFFEPSDENDLKNYVTTNEDYYELWRLLMGIPSRPKELNPKIIPIEANMWPSISFTKGCYIGQETIARIRYRGKVKKNLACIRVPKLINKNAPIFNSKNKLVGEICNYFYFEKDNITCVLAYIDTEENFENNIVKIDEIKSKIIKNLYKIESEKLLDI